MSKCAAGYRLPPPHQTCSVCGASRGETCGRWVTWAQQVIDAARECWDEACRNHDSKDPPGKYLAPWGGLAKIGKALAAFPPPSETQP